MSGENANKLHLFNGANRMAKRMIFVTLCTAIFVFVSMARPLNAASAVASSRRIRRSSQDGGITRPQNPLSSSSSSEQSFPFHNNNIPTSASLVARRKPLALLHRNKPKKGAAASSTSSSSSSTASTDITITRSTASNSKLGALAAYFDACLIVPSSSKSDSDNCACGIDTQRFLEACRQLESFMVSVGHKQSAKDLMQNIKKIEGLCSKTPAELRQTILDLLQYEKSTGIHDGLSKSPSVRVLDEESGAMGLLWIKRSLSFQHTMYSLILENPDMDSGGDDLDEENENSRTINTVHDQVAQQQASMTRTRMDHATDDSLLLDVPVTSLFNRTPRRRGTIATSNTGIVALSMAGSRTTRMVSTSTMTKPSPSLPSSTTTIKCPADAAQVAYARVLEPHHGWALRKIYALALKSTTPATRRGLLAELGGFQLSSSSSSSLSEMDRQQLAIAENDLRLLVASWGPVRVCYSADMYAYLVVWYICFLLIFVRCSNLLRLYNNVCFRSWIDAKRHSRGLTWTTHAKSDLAFSLYSFSNPQWVRTNGERDTLVRKNAIVTKC
jgi:Glycolipid transfer protein (GLTP)